MKVLVINSGSSSIKFRLAEVKETGNGEFSVESASLEGAVKGIGGPATVEARGVGLTPVKTSLEVRNHVEAFRVLFDRFGGDFRNIAAVGHRVVHGGDRFMNTTLITNEVEAGIDALSDFAPLHNPASLAGIRGAKAAWGSSIPMVAVFDTAFHQTMPEVARRYAISGDMAERHHIRRYGFHGIAHASLAQGYA